jgi:hypothetical protein
MNVEALMRWIHIYENPDTSEVSDEFATMFWARQYRARPQAQIVRNGEVLANAVGGEWVLTSAGSALVASEAMATEVMEQIG